MNTTTAILSIIGIVVILIAYVRLRISRYENDVIIQNTWQEHIVNFTISTKEFYGILEQIILEKNIPDLYVNQVGLHEGDWPSRKRLYLRISYKTVIYFVFASPMGEDFFISYRMGFRPDLIAKEDETQTFYQVDSEIAFAESMHKIIIRSVDVITKQYGNRQFQSNIDDEDFKNI